MTNFIVPTGPAGRPDRTVEPDDADVAPRAAELDIEADAADVIEQHRSVPSGDDDYER